MRALSDADVLASIAAKEDDSIEARGECMFNSLSASLAAIVCSTAVSPLSSNQAVSWPMLQFGIMWLTLISVFFILD